MNRLNLVRKEDMPPADDFVLFVSLLSGKGGVGKSILTFNLAERLETLGYRILVVDADFSSGNQHVLANVDCDYGVAQIASGQLSLREAVTNYRDNLDLLVTGSSGPVSQLHDPISAASLMQKLHDQTSDYDFVLIDHASGVSEIAAAIAHASDINLLLLVPELTSIMDAYGLYKFLISIHDRLHCLLLINRVESDDEGDYIHKKFGAIAERFLDNVPGLAGCLPEDKAVRNAVACQRSLAETAEESPILEALTATAIRLVKYLPTGRSFIQSKSINKTTAMADIRR